MLDWDDRKARWRHRWSRWRARWTGNFGSMLPMSARGEKAAAIRATGRTRMDDTIETGVQQALARTVLEKSSRELREALLAEVWAQHREALQQQAFEAVRREHQHELARLEEALRDRFARERQGLEHELEAELERRWQAEQHRLEEDMGERLQRLRTTREGWKARAEAAEAQLVFLIQQLLSEERRRYLRDSHVEKLDLSGLNGILHRHGLAIRAAARPSERVVKTMLGPNRLEDRHVFWIERVDPSRPPVEEDDEDEPADTPALPPAAEACPGRSEAEGGG
jgi:hypothetical protein